MEPTKLNGREPSRLSRSQKTVAELNLKIKSLEETTLYYQNLFHEIRDQLRALENQKQQVKEIKADDLPVQGEYEEDWKELYFEENEKKEALENELDSTSQRLEEVEKLLQEQQVMGENVNNLRAELSAAYEEIDTHKRTITQLQERMQAKSPHEEECEKIAVEYKRLRENQQVLQQENARLKAQSEDQKEQLMTLSQKRGEQERIMKRNGELESVVSLYRMENGSVKRRVEEMISQNKMFRN